MAADIISIARGEPSGVRSAADAARAAAPRVAPRSVSAPAGYQLAYQMGGPNYMYGVTPRFGAYYRDGGTPPGQIHGNMPGSREGADMFGFWPTMFQSSPYATASQMYTPGLGVMPLIGYPSRYPHVIMGGYSNYAGGIENQALGMMLPLLMMGLYRQMFPMPGMPGAAGGAGGRGGAGGSGGGGKSSGGGTPAKEAPFVLPDGRNGHYQNLEEALAQPDSRRVYDYQGFDPDYAMRGTARSASAPSSSAPSVSDGWVSRALRLGMATPGLSPFASMAGAALEYPRIKRLAEDNPVATRTIVGSIPGTGGLQAAGIEAAPVAREYFFGH